ARRPPARIMARPGRRRVQSGFFDIFSLRLRNGAAVNPWGTKRPVTGAAQRHPHYRWRAGAESSGSRGMKSAECRVQNEGNEPVPVILHSALCTLHSSDVEVEVELVRMRAEGDLFGFALALVADPGVDHVLG